jgi:hypothetical protein
MWRHHRRGCELRGQVVCCLNEEHGGSSLTVAKRISANGSSEQQRPGLVVRWQQAALVGGSGEQTWDGTATTNLLHVPYVTTLHKPC